MKKILKAKAVGIVSLISFALATGGTVWAYYALRRVGGTPLILHFDDLSGITSVGSLGTLLFMGMFSIGIVIVNYFIALELDLRDRFLGKFAAAITFVFALLIFLAFAAIINVNV